MIEVDKEKSLTKHPLVTIAETELILKQMRYSICTIKNENGDGTGFFCQISNKKLLLTNNHVINEELIKNKNIITVKLNDDKIKKNIKIKDYYTSIEYDTTIIEINDNDENINYLEIDDDIFDENINLTNKKIYIIQYPTYGNEQKASVSYGLLNKIKDEYNLEYFCSTEHGSSGSPILGLSNNKIIGIHKESLKNYEFNRGTLLKYPINEYLNKNDEIKLKLKIGKFDINKDIYFLDNNTKGHDNLKELNELNTEIFIDNKKYKYTKCFKPEKEGLYEIKIKFKNNIKDCSSMFSDCSYLKNIDLSSFDTKNVTNISNMFNGCSDLTNINLSSIDTKNVTNMNGMFKDCSKLTNIDLSSIDTKNVTNMSHLFDGCSNLTNINLSSIDTKNVTNMSFMFHYCSKLTNINLSSFNTKNVTNISYMFHCCSSLTNIDLSSFNTKNVTDMSSIFYKCYNLTNIDLSFFDTKNVTNMSYMFYDCSNLTNLDLSLFDTKNVTKMSYMFYDYSKLNLVK